MSILDLLGTTIGRIRVVDLVGQGGMGTVYVGYDETLDRRVALKVIRAEFRMDDQARERFLREARILSQLDHPNVCTVHDFAVTDDADVLVMELVEGRDLRSALDAGLERSEVLGVARRLLEVLVAVHAAGVVHRDLKPENVMLTPSGGLKVLDFGLSRSVGELDRQTVALQDTTVVTPGAGPRPGDLEAGATLASPPPVPRSEGRSRRSTVLAETRAGAILGTLGYMSPEQARGEPATAASDVYSFGLMLQELLTGERPFEPAPAEELLRRAAAGESRPVSGLSIDLTRLLEHLLAHDPGDRPTAEEALAALVWILERPMRRRRVRLRLGAAVLGVVAAAGVGFGLWQMGASRARLFDAGPDRVAEVWGPARQAELEQAFAATGVPWAEAAWHAVAAVLDRYTGQWLEAHREACEARLSGERSEVLLDRQLACLEQRIREVDHLVALLEEARGDELADAHQAARELRSLGPCTDATALAFEVPPPSDPQLVAQMDEVRERLAQVEALRMVGRADAAWDLSSELAAEAEAVGHPPLVAEVLASRGFLAVKLGRLDEAEQVLDAAYVAAERGAADRAAVSAASQLVHVLGLSEGLDAAERWADLAMAKIDRLGGGRELEMEVLHNLAGARTAAGRYEQAYEAASRALELSEEVLGPDALETGENHDQLADTLSYLARYDEAFEHRRRAVAIAEARLGPRHPDLVGDLNDLGYQYLTVGRVDEGVATLERALAVGEEVLGRGHLFLATVLNNLGYGYQLAGDLERARTAVDRGLEVLVAAGRAGTSSHAINLMGRADLLAELGRLDEALADARQAADILDRAVGPDHPYAGLAANNVGALLSRAGRPVDAIPYLERALAVGSEDPVVMGWRRHSLAKVLLAAGRDRRRVEELVAAARADFEAAGTRGQKDLAELEEWARAELGRE